MCMFFISFFEHVYLKRSNHLIAKHTVSGRSNQGPGTQLSCKPPAIVYGGLVCPKSAKVATSEHQGRSRGCSTFLQHIKTSLRHRIQWRDAWLHKSNFLFWISREICGRSQKTLCNKSIFLFLLVSRHEFYLHAGRIHEGYRKDTRRILEG